MADEPEKSGQEPNLELPSLLGFGRKKKRKGEDAQGGLDETTAEPRGGLAPAAEKPKRRPPVPPPTRADKPTEQLPASPRPVVQADEVLAPPAPAEETVVIEQTAVVTTEPPVELVAPVYGEQEPVEGTEDQAEDPAPVRQARSVSLPAINPRVAAFVTGALIGLVGVVLAFLAGRGCEAVRGVGSCGGIGLFALLVILAIQILLGAAVLSAWRVYDPVSTSFLGVGLAAVFVLLFLLSSLESVWMFVVIPVLSGLMFVLSWWVTAAFVEDANSR
jgi:hypothetical protein